MWKNQERNTKVSMSCARVAGKTLRFKYRFEEVNPETNDKMIAMAANAGGICDTARIPGASTDKVVDAKKTKGITCLHICVQERKVKSTVHNANHHAIHATIVPAIQRIVSFMVSANPAGCIVDSDIWLLEAFTFCHL